MRTPDLDQIRDAVTLLLGRILAGEQLDVLLVGALLIGVIIVCFVSIWRNRALRAKAPVPAPTIETAPEHTSALTRWLTPVGMRAVAAEPAAAERPRRVSGKQPTIRRVSTPVSRVPAKALKHAGADALSIARKSGLARDAVVMMMANAAPARVAPTAAKAKAPTPTVPSERAMLAPWPTSAGNWPAPAAGGRAIGTKFNARLG